MSDGKQACMQRTSNYRGYIATWEIKNKILFLEKINGYYCKSDDQKGFFKKASLKTLFPKKMIGSKQIGFQVI